MKKSLIALAALVAAVGAQAATISGSFNFPVANVSTTELDGTIVGTSLGTLGLFNSNLGTLTGATLTHQGKALFSFSAKNGAAQAQDADIQVRTRIFWDSSIAALDALLTGDTILLSQSTGFQSYAPGETKSFGPFSPSQTHIDNLAGILASLQAPGGGNFTVSCRTASGLSIDGGGGNITTTQSTQAGCGATLEYVYEPRQQVPEPASLAMVGLALAGLAATRRRKV